MSADLLTPEKALIFRIVHKDNIGEVLQSGCHCRTTMVGQSKYVEIGNLELIQKRTQREVPCEPGGTLSDYVPFYFTPYTPMLYNIKTGHGVPQKPVGDIIILVSSLHRLAKIGLPFVFTDRHAYLKTAQFSNDLKNLDWIIWKVLQARDFKKDDVDKFEKYQAEALIHKHVPISALVGIVCYDKHTRDAIRGMPAAQSVAKNIIAQPSWFL
ncbi:MAG: DUF4433 domain-containing protein [Asticcacaulis sp.]|uniref:type II toxin-antitoxin system toxin DNA ADP-ribosyl transferase DarT n=1 Tax=Asticcacaulis sp. TaxID=1872648 RepID=UPI0039E61A5D